MLLVFFRAEVAARQHQDQRIAALKLAQGADGGRVIRQRVIGEDAARDDVGTQGMTRLSECGVARPPRCMMSTPPEGPAVHAGNPRQGARPRGVITPGPPAFMPDTALINPARRSSAGQVPRPAWLTTAAATDIDVAAMSRPAHVPRHRCGNGAGPTTSPPHRCWVAPRTRDINVATVSPP